MTIGPLLDGVAWICAGLAVGAALASAPGLRAPRATANLALALSGAAVVGTLGLLAFLASRFLATDLSYQYVFFYTGTEVEWPWRLAGTWAGREGSLLLWAMWLSLATFGVALLHKVRPTLDDAEARARSWTFFILALVLAAFLVAVAQQSAFLPTSEDLLAGRPTGNGLNPTLKSGFILIHPPMMFAAYAVATIPLAAALGHLASGTDRWSRVAMPWGRLGWLLMTCSLGLGALWAYYTLGFGGYWAWDPVEVANLLPWLAFTVYLHAQLHHERHGTYGSMGPFLAGLPFLLTLFSTISTRSGLWFSVHAFTDPTDTFNLDAAGRFLDILRVEPTLSFYVGLYLGVLALLLALWCHRLAAGRFRLYSRIFATLLVAFAAYALVAPASAFSFVLEISWRASGSAGLGLLGLTILTCLLAALPMLVGPPADAGEPGQEKAARTSTAHRPRSGLQRIHLRSLLGYSVLSLGLALLILFLFHVAAAQYGSTAGFYEERFPYLALPIILGLLVFQGHQAFGRRRSLEVAGLALGVAAVAWYAARWKGDYRLAQGALLAIPALFLVAVGFTRIRRAGTPPGTPKAIRRADTLLLGAALLDVLFWLNPPAVRLGSWSWTPTWPMQAIFGALALLALWVAVRTLAGAPPRRLGIYTALTGALGAFYVAPVLAFLSWILRRQDAKARKREPSRLEAWRSDRPRARLHQVALHGVHFAIALALLGYAPSTYLKSQADLELDQGVAQDIAGYSVTYVGTRMDATPGIPATIVRPDFAVDHARAPGATVSGELRWEPAAGAHYPLPSTLRSWTGDLYLDVEEVHIAPGSPCLGPSHTDGAWVQAYRAGSPSRICNGDVVDKVRANVVVLPGLALLWLALAVGVGGMAVLMATSRPSLATPTPEA